MLFNANPIDNSANITSIKANIATNVPQNNTSSSINQEMVWVDNKTAKVYHSSKTCSNMKSNDKG